MKLAELKTTSSPLAEELKELGLTWTDQLDEGVLESAVEEWYQVRWC